MYTYMYTCLLSTTYVASSFILFYIIIVGYDVEVEWKSRLWINIYYYYENIRTVDRFRVK